jgi:general secretion pathway protein F
LPVFNYKGYDAASGSQKKGKVEAESVKAARQKLRQRDGIMVSEIKEEESASKAKTKSRFSSSRVSQQDVAIMTRQFATLQTASVPLDESLRALTQQVENPVLRNALSSVKDQISEGKSLGEAMSSFPGVFDRLYVNMVKAGESSGTMALVLERLADFIEYQVKIRGQIVSAMTYPAVMIVASSSIVVFLFVSVVPKLQKVFISLKVQLPWYTELLIKLSEFLQSYWWLVGAGGVMGYFLFKYWVGSESGRRKFDAWLLRAPVFGPIVLRTNVSRFTRTLSTLLNSGVPIISAIEITKNVIPNSVIAGVLDEAKVAVQEGKSLSATIERSEQFPPLVTHMIMTGEKTGQLEEMLGHVATAYDAEVERKVNSMIALIEPAMVILMAGGAGGILAALMIPMLSVMNRVR